ncbi:hypothetical protein ITJ86_01705 [Winogradskyella sp. F6397]|uniref:DUF3558 domain-containing protein n=1 Tax=Winogradskyella marina TaxID=2785530 RepID=A0ABS0EEI7_9FLAO|nr:hypothetical protein [Winogradskyella marina]MBF8148591.1 hypothetical protein [Winogradskyella marina]
MKKLLILLLIFTCTIACGNSEKTASEQTEHTIDTNLSPCDLVTEPEIKSALSIPADAETSMNEKDTTYPICLYKWKSVTWPFERYGHTIDYAAELSIVLVNNASKSNYEASIKVYKDGIKENGIGEMSTWSEKKTQITFLSKGKLIHVHSRTTADAASNKAKTINLAKQIVKNI